MGRSEGPRTCVRPRHRARLLTVMDAEVQSVATALGDVERAIPMSAIKGTNTQKGKQLRQWRSRLASLVDGMPPNPDTAFDDVLREAVELHDAVKDDAIKTSTLSGWRDRAARTCADTIFDLLPCTGDRSACDRLSDALWSASLSARLRTKR